MPNHEQTNIHACDCFRCMSLQERDWFNLHFHLVDALLGVHDVEGQLRQVDRSISERHDIKAHAALLCAKESLDIASTALEKTQSSKSGMAQLDRSDKYLAIFDDLSSKVKTQGEIYRTLVQSLKMTPRFVLPKAISRQRFDFRMTSMARNMEYIGKLLLDHHDDYHMTDALVVAARNIREYATESRQETMREGRRSDDMAVPDLAHEKVISQFGPILAAFNENLEIEIGSHASGIPGIENFAHRRLMTPGTVTWCPTFEVLRYGDSPDHEVKPSESSVIIYVHRDKKVAQTLEDTYPTGTRPQLALAHIQTIRGRLDDPLRAYHFSEVNMQEIKRQLDALEKTVATTQE